jgi:hypothetical protein
MNFDDLLQIDVSQLGILPPKQESVFNSLRTRISIANSLVMFLNWHNLGDNWFVRFHGKSSCTIDHKEDKYHHKHFLIRENQLESTWEN